MATKKKWTAEEAEANKKEKLAEITGKLEQGVREIFESRRLQDYLSYMGRFKTYSFRNELLIWLQNPDARVVAGYVAWNKQFDRHVKRGEKGIQIVAQTTKKYKTKVLDEDGNEVEVEKVRIIYVPTTVFGDNQTEPNDPDNDQLAFCPPLKGDVNDYENLKAKLISVSPCPVSFEEIRGTSHGFFSPKENRIVVRCDDPEAQTIKTLIHEMSHAMLHGKNGSQRDVDRETMEVQAESVAYTVSNYLGLDTGDYTFPYIASWAREKETKLLTESLALIHETATTIIDSLAA